MGAWIDPGTSWDRSDHSEQATCRTTLSSDQGRDKYFPGLGSSRIAQWPIVVPVQLFFFMNTSNKLRGIHSTRLGRDQIVKERCPRCRGTKSCLRCPGTYQLTPKRYTREYFSIAMCLLHCK